MRTVSFSFLLAWTLLACDPSNGPSSETDIDRCSNGVDDDGDGAIDCADVGCAAYAFCLYRDAGPDGSAPTLPDGSVCSFDAVDLVIVLDVSGSMSDEMQRLRDRLSTLEGLPLRLSLVVFVDDALAVQSCAPFASLDGLSTEIETWRLRSADNLSPVSGVYNQDCAENGLDALYLAATMCPWRPEAAHLALYLTDDTFAERPTVLSGPYGPGVVVQRTYSEVVDALRRADIQVVSLTLPGAGESCGAGRSPSVGEGFHEAYEGMQSIPAATAGLALSLAELRTGALDMGATLTSLRQDACPTIADAGN